MIDAKNTATVNRLRQRAELSPADRDGPTFLTAASFLEKHAKTIEKLEKQISIILERHYPK